MTISLIIALVYEILLKLSHILIPSLFNISPVSGITSVLSFIVGVIIILFMFSFYKEEKHNKKFELMLKLLIGCIVIHFMLRLPTTQRMIDFRAVRLLGDIIGFVKAILFFVLLILYRREIPSGEKLMTQATVFLIVMFGIGTVESLYSLIDFARFVISGITVNYSPIFYNIMFILFLITHLSIIYFLYRYYQFKFSTNKYINYTINDSNLGIEPTENTPT
jgi:hypothetical protein